MRTSSRPRLRSCGTGSRRSSAFGSVCRCSSWRRREDGLMKVLTATSRGAGPGDFSWTIAGEPVLPRAGRTTGLRLTGCAPRQAGSALGAADDEPTVLLAAAEAARSRVLRPEHHLDLRSQ